MKDRREFLKSAATGAMLLGSSAAADGLGLAGMLAQSGGNGKSRVVVARDAALHGTGSQLDEKRVLEVLDRALTSYFGRTKPMEAWKLIGFPNVAKNRVIGIKVNGLGGQGDFDTCRAGARLSASGCNRPAFPRATLWCGTATPAILRLVG